MKVYTLGRHGFATPQIAAAVGTGTRHRQVDVFVAARSKAAAYALLAARRLAPGSVHDPDFRVATGDDVDALRAAGVLTDGVVLVKKLHAMNGPVVWVEADGHIAQCGEFVRGQFVPDGELVAGGGLPEPAPVKGDSYLKAKELLLAQLTASRHRYAAAEAELERVRKERNALCLRAADEFDAVGEAAEALGVTPVRVYQMRDRALLEQAQAAKAVPAQGGD